MRLPGSDALAQRACQRLVGFDDFSRANAGRADTGSPVCSVDDDANPLEVGIPSSFRDVVGMADIIAKNRAFATDITACRHITPLMTPN